MICKNCGYNNSKQRLVCKKCHANLVEAYLEDYENDKLDINEDIYEEKIQKSSNRKDKDNGKTKTKTKTKVKTKTKKTVEKEKGKDTTNTIYKEKTPFGTKVLIFFMIMLILGLGVVLAFICYKYYEKTYNIEVPNVVGLTYHKAELKIIKKDLNIKKKEVEVTSEDEVGLVIRQSKSEGTKVKKGTVIKVYIGVLEKSKKNSSNKKISTISDDNSDTNKSSGVDTSLNDDSSLVEDNNNNSNVEGQKEMNNN